MAKKLPSISLADNFALPYLRISPGFSFMLCPVVFNEVNTFMKKALAGILFTWVASRFYY